MKILVIDDDHCTRCLIEDALHSEGHQVLAAANGISGMRLMRMEQPDIVITDILMPDEDGLGVIRSMQREFPAVKKIAISGGGTRSGLDLLETARLLGADATLVKPIEPQQLFETVNRFASR